MATTALLRVHARSIWQASVAAVRPAELLGKILTSPDQPLRQSLERARRIQVVGAGKAGAAMAAAVEAALPHLLARMEGVVNVPAEAVRPLQRIALHAARPAGTNQPTAEGVAGSERILDLVANAGPDDVALCLISGGGSALMPAPVPGVSLADKQQLTRLLHACGATINEMNCVRKHLSRCKGGRLAQAFTGRELFSLIISDVVGDPLDVIASGPTAADPTTFAQALAILAKYRMVEQTSQPIRDYLVRGQAGQEAETLKALPRHVTNLVVGNNSRALAAAGQAAEALGYRVLNLGSYVEGETSQVAIAHAGIVRSIRNDQAPLPAPTCLLSGGETTVTLGAGYGLGGRNQEFALAAAMKLRESGNLKDVVVLSGGTDGEDGPTDAAGGCLDEEIIVAAGVDPAPFLARHDAYSFLAQTGGLLKTGLTGTNVMDIRVILIG